MNGREERRVWVVHPFEPIYDKNSRILILGSFPSVKSREVQFYYGNHQNRFWQVLAQIFQCPLPETVSQKRKLLLDHGIALWDILKSCAIEGSSDASIHNPQHNDLAWLLEATQIQRVCFNGKKAYQIYQRYCPKLPVPVQVLPSTSPANAAYSLKRLCEIWQQAFLL